MTIAWDCRSRNSKTLYHVLLQECLCCKAVLHCSHCPHGFVQRPAWELRAERETGITSHDIIVIHYSRNYLFVSVPHQKANSLRLGIWCSSFMAVLPIASTVLGPKWAFKEQLFTKWIWSKVLLVNPNVGSPWLSFGLPFPTTIPYSLIHWGLFVSLKSVPGSHIIWAQLNSNVSLHFFASWKTGCLQSKLLCFNGTTEIIQPNMIFFLVGETNALRGSLTLQSLTAYWSTAGKKVLSSCFPIWGSTTALCLVKYVEPPSLWWGLHVQKDSPCPP